MDRLRGLQGLVKELSSQLEQARAIASVNSGDGEPSTNSPRSSNQDHDTDHHAGSSSVGEAANVQKKFGRLVLGDASQSCYVSSGFWSRVQDELDGLKMDTEVLAGAEYDSSGDEDSPEKTSSTHELDRTPSERHAFLFRHNLNPQTPDNHAYHPLPSQVPFLLNVFSENVNLIMRVVHMPTVNKMIQSLRGNDFSTMTPANEALMFAIYYAAITSMEEDDVMTNFGSSKFELNLKYRLGLERALAKADFLNAPDITLVQAFTIFLFLLRRHESPKFVWMMTGLVIRMAQALGLQRDGSHFAHLTPYEVEIRRRVWWAVCMLDVRSSEDQGADLTIAHGSFDTRLPLNINDADIDLTTKEMPKETEGLSDMTISLVSCCQCDVTRRMMAVSLKGGVDSLDEQAALLDEMQETMERNYLRYSNASGNIAYWAEVIVMRLVMAKMTLLTYLPVLFSSPNKHVSDEIRTKLFVAALEVAEYNHALNAEQACRQWRWIFQTYSHWHAIVYLLLAAAQRPWSPLVERAWVALHSIWLIPAGSIKNKNLPIWIPLRKLTEKARRHRDAELERLRRDPQAAQSLEDEDRHTPQPDSPGPLPGVDSAESFRERWRQLLAMPANPQDEALGLESAHFQSSLPQSCGVPLSNLPGRNFSQGGLDMVTNTPSQSAAEQPASWSWTPCPKAHGDLDAGFGAWMWADADPTVDIFANMDVEAVNLNMELDGEIDWNNWVESAKGMECPSQPPASSWPYQ